MPVSDPWLPTDDDGSVPLQRDPVPVGVYRYDPTTGRMDLFPNVVVVSIASEMGTDPGVALLRYVFDGVTAGAPRSVEEALSTAFTGANVVMVGDRLVVRAQRPDGALDVLFHGEPMDFRMQLDGATERVVITCHGIARRTRLKPIGGALMRRGDNPFTVADFETDLVAQFNPRGVPNATPAGADAGAGTKTYPTFLDPLIVRTDDARRKWTLDLAVRYLMFRYNDEQYVDNPDPSVTDTLLVAKEPNGAVPFDPGDARSYDAKPLECPDTPITGKDWPGVVNHLVAGQGFGTYFRTSTGPGGRPRDELVIFASQSRDPKQLILQARGSDLDPARSNVSACGLGRDLSGVVNEWTVKGALDRHEASFVLAPGFPMSSGDVAGVLAYDKASTPYLAGLVDPYRLFVCDETGEGHYLNGSSTPLTAVKSFDAVFGAGKYTVRRRPGIGTLVSVDGNHKPLRARLSYSTDYAGAYPSTWDRSGTWSPIAGGWDLLKDRLGIRIDVEHPNKWHVGDSAAGTPIVLKAVQALAAPDAANPAFFLRLTCVVEADECLEATAARRDNSPLVETVAREIDARDRLKKTAISASSELNDTGGAITGPVAGKPYTAAVRDDSDAALAEATAARYATDNGVLSGPVVIPRFTNYYELGDRIDRIEGRNIGLRTNVGGGAADAPIYPVVVQVRWDFEGKQQTTLTLSDASRARADVNRRGRKRPYR